MGFHGHGHWHYIDETERRKWQNPEAILIRDRVETGDYLYGYRLW